MATIGGGMRKKILLKAPILTRSGYGEHGRFALRALRSREELFDIYIQPLQWGATSWMNERSEERDWIDNIIEKTIAFIQQGGQFDMSLQVTIPNEWIRLAPINIGVTAGIESTRVAPLWLQKGNEMDKIVVVSEHAKRTYADTVYSTANEQTGEQAELKLDTEIEVVNYPVKEFGDIDELELSLEYDFNFLTVAQFGPRKNIPNTIKWFVEEFQNDEVGLVLKTNLAKNCLMDREKLFNEMKQQLATLPEHKCKIYLLHGDMTDEEMHALYLHPKLKAFVLLSHGEGFGLPTFEAAYSGMPIVTPGWSGYLDFLVNKKTGVSEYHNVEYDIQPIPDSAVWENVLIKESMWANPREHSVKQQMRQCYANIETSKKVANKLAKRIKKDFTEEVMHAKFISAIVNEGEFDVENWLSGLNIEEIE
jgi:glycosyltransferase involved in cell wall biosynthesis|tara:strand:- start:1751 stop:3016 length:1266 start_codon:yes stop_codon:yes gene_type:complete